MSSLGSFGSGTLLLVAQVVDEERQAVGHVHVAPATVEVEREDVEFIEKLQNTSIVPLRTYSINLH